MAIAYLLLGSNKGDRVSYLQQAATLLGANGNICIIRTSTFYETEPWGNKQQEWFVNAAIEIKTNLLPYELLNFLLDIETRLGRNRETEIHWGARTIDIDILFYDNQILVSEDLTIPHKFLHERAFVLVPLLELIPDFYHPVYKKTISELYDLLENPESVYLYGTRIFE